MTSDNIPDVDENELCRQMQVLRRAMMKKVNSAKQTVTESTKTNNSRILTKEQLEKNEKKIGNSKHFLEQITDNKFSIETTSKTSCYSISSSTLPLVFANPLSTTS